MVQRNKRMIALMTGCLVVAVSIYVAVTVASLTADEPKKDNAFPTNAIALSDANKFHARISKILVSQRLRVQYNGPIGLVQGLPGLAPDTDSQSLSWVAGLVEGDSNLYKKIFTFTLHTRKPSKESVQVMVGNMTYYITVSPVKNGIGLEDNAFTGLDGEDLPNVSIRSLLGLIGDSK